MTPSRRPLEGMRASAPRRRGRTCLQLALVFLFLLPALIGIPAVVGYAYVDHQVNHPANPGNSKARVVVPLGATFSEVADTLHQAGLVDNPLVFRLYARYKHLDRSVEAGAYDLSHNLNMPQLLQALQTSRPEEIFITIPEGYTIQKAAQKLDQLGGPIKGADYLALAQHGQFSYDFLNDRPAGASLEGFLFPDTYLVPRSGSAKDLITAQLTAFGRNWTAERKALAAKRKLNVLQIVTLASIIEREARFDVDRPLVASVFYNRLAIGMPLQADATVLYAKGVWQSGVTLDDRKVDSPYNTYLHGGLPPGPIANPGLKSIDAALQPGQSTYLYYLSDPQGHNHYATTYDQFVQLLHQYGLQ
jgi:UPF0755 protein